MKSLLNIPGIFISLNKGSSQWNSSKRCVWNWCIEVPGPEVWSPEACLTPQLTECGSHHSGEVWCVGVSRIQKHDTDLSRSHSRWIFYSYFYFKHFVKWEFSLKFWVSERWLYRHYCLRSFLRKQGIIIYHEIHVLCLIKWSFQDIYGR